MRRFLRTIAARSPVAVALAVAAAVIWPTAALPAAGATGMAGSTSKATFTLTISGIDRDGTPLGVSASVYGFNGVQYLSSGSTTSVPAGTYVVAAPIWRLADGSTQTLVAKKIHITANTHVTLNAQGAVAVDAAVSVPSVTQGGQSVELCIGGGSNFNAVTGFLVESPGTVYVKPMSAIGLRTVYQTLWQGAGTFYDVAGEFNGGIPAHPVYHATPATMARVHVQMRDYENVTPLAAVITDYGNCGSLDPPVTSLPAAYTDYRTPGDWTTNLNFGTLPTVQRDLWTNGNYLAGHTYSELFGSAAAGPGNVFPVIDGSHVTYSPVNLFSDPVVKTGFDCEGKAIVSLLHGSSLVKSQKLTFCGNVNNFSVHVANPGWYTMTATAMRWNPTGGLPGVLLSPSVSMRWHFHFAPVTGHVINVQAVPVTVTRFQPQGLGLYNHAFAGSTTTLRITILRGGGQPVATPRYRLQTIRVQASTNNGLTWQTLTLSLNGSFWLAHVHNPAIGGYVWLRSTITDSHGDSTMETISRAYLVLGV